MSTTPKTETKSGECEGCNKWKEVYPVAGRHFCSDCDPRSCPVGMSLSELWRINRLGLNDTDEPRKRGI